ncbi:hypothetical protein QCA50_009052 [Cerrena zonata]|uniref:RED-like N-terminal domain-containing protein n=1 Tax=Cerrena zonata TaxID=2478898 RepID=A0AAW0G280_9APHY
MDQESFRKLLHSSATSKQPSTRATLGGVTSSKGKGKKAEPSQPAFKPRTVKKEKVDASNYRNRAAERRQGVAGDYAEVEAIAEDFERRAAELDKKTLDEQRKYLGGDADHTVLVKGLDFALLEQNKAKVAAEQGVEDDETLEQVFLEASGMEKAKESSDSATSGKKRTREELVRVLKNKRAKSGAVEEDSKTVIDDAVKLEEAKKAGKFKPIGFKPIAQDKPKKKVKKVKTGDATVKAAKAKAVTPSVTESQQPIASSSSTQPPSKPQIIGTLTSKALPEPEPEPIDEDFDIFAGAGEYAGVDLGSSSDSEGEVQNPTNTKPAHASRSSSPQPIPAKKWFDDVDEDRPLKRNSSRPRSKSRSRPTGGDVEMGSPRSRSPSRPQSGRSPNRSDELEDGEEDEVPMRLQPLSSSAVPSIREILAMDEDAEKAAKRKARKEKKGKKLDKEGKVERDYQRLKSYTDKKAAKGGE